MLQPGLQIDIPAASPTSPTARAMSTSAYSPSSPLSGSEPAISRRRSQDAMNRGYLSSTYLAKITEEEAVGLQDSARTPPMHGGRPPSPSATRGLFDQEYSPVTTTFPSRVHRTRAVSGNREQLSRMIPVSASRRPILPALRRWILNPLSITTGRYHLRSLSTLFIWLLTLWTLVNYLLPAASTISDSQSPSKNAFGWIPSPWKSKSKAPTIPTPYFPEPPTRPGDAFNSPNRLYRPFLPLDGPDLPFPRLRPTRFLPPKCLESWFADGEILCGRHQLGPEEMLDITWLWVNGSDPRWQKDMQRVRQEKGIYSPDHHFRENNELLFSMRSVLQNLPGRLRTFHLITADTAFDVEKDLGLLPHQAIRELEQAAEKEYHLLPSEGRRLGDQGMNLRNKRTVKSAFSLEARAGGRIPDNAAHQPSTPDPIVSDRLKMWLNSTWRIAQAPKWLAYDMIDLSSPKHPLHALYINPTTAKPAEAAHLYFNSHPSLKYAGHSEIFHLPSRPPLAGASPTSLRDHKQEEKKWRQGALPNFNSMAIESRIGFLWGLGDVSLSFNDDFFILKPHAVSDFYSPLYGTVIRFDQGVSSRNHASLQVLTKTRSQYYQQVKPLLDKAWINDAGEVGGLYHANWLLSQRFPRRLRPYFAHVPKVITRGLHHEATIMFADAINAAAQRQFRELSIGEGSVQMQWLISSMRVERWREALLWTWVVAKVGSAPQWQHEETGERLGGEVGTWGAEARQEIRDLFGMGDQDDDVIKIEVHLGERWTLEEDRMKAHFQGAGWEAPKATEFLFSSMDGHMPPIPKPSQSSASNDQCTFDLERCLGPFWSRQETVSADDMFKRLAFANPSCGDCCKSQAKLKRGCISDVFRLSVIMTLVTASGPLGLSAVFPPREAIFKNDVDADTDGIDYISPPHLPLTSTWQEADFSLDNVLRETSLPQEEVNLREWSMKLLSRYLYVSGKSNSHFHMAKSPRHVQNVFHMIDSNKDVALLGFNDDIEEDYEETRALMLKWFQSRWPRKMIWERD